MSAVLVGDVGGTHVRFGFGARDAQGRIVIADFRKLAADPYPDFESVLQAYLDDVGVRPEAALFALAGPKSGDAVRLTNRPWTVSVQRLRDRFGLRSVRLENDFAAMARAAPELAPEAFVSIRPGTPDPSRPILVAGPGTGFGMATLAPRHAGGWRVLSGEGGHQCFAPCTDFEWQVARRLRDAYGHVSVERVCAGVGYPSVLKACAEAMDRPAPDWSPQDCLDAAARADALALAVCRLRAATILATAADMALAISAQGGVVIAGGVAERLLPYLQEPEALVRFADRGPMSAFLAPIPIRLLQEPSAPLTGAAALHWDGA